MWSSYADFLLDMTEFESNDPWYQEEGSGVSVV